MNEYNQVYQERKQKVMQLLTDSAQQLREDGQEQDAKNLEGFREKVEEGHVQHCDGRRVQRR